MSHLVFHFTDTARLPWILLAGELRPGRNRIASFPDPDFLWATTSPLGDRSASASSDGFRSGLTRMVRFVLRAEDFQTWPAITEDFPAWTPGEVARLERAAEGLSRPSDWRCRAAPLPRDAWIGIETRSYADKTWRPFYLDDEVHMLNADTAGIWVCGKLYISTPFEHPSGATGYSVQVGVRENAA